VRASAKLPAPNASAKGWLGRAITMKKAVVILARLFNSGENPHSAKGASLMKSHSTFVQFGSMNDRGA
jgi:hypothetical protein